MDAPPPDHGTIARGLSETFPDLGPVIITNTLVTGFNSIAVETDGGLVFRLAKTAGTAERFAMETRLLPILSERLPVAVPDPQWFSPASEHFPLGSIGYRKIEGRTLQPGLVTDTNRNALAAQVTGVLLALHDAPLDEFVDIGLPKPQEMPANYRSLAEETLPVLERRMPAAEFEEIERWWEALLADERMADFAPALTHGDFWFENMIVDEGASRLTGIVDWEHAAIGDTAQDLATQNLGAEFTELVLQAYCERGDRFDDDDRYRVRRLWELRHFYGVLYGIRFDDEPELLDSIRKLRGSPILTALDEP